MKLAFFDIDGVLSAPRYRTEDGTYVIGLSTDEEWDAYCEAMGSEGYRDCRPVPFVRDYARQLSTEGTRLFVLSAASSAAEEGAKRRFVEEHYPGLFEAFYFVAGNSEKVPLLLKIAAREGAAPADCTLVEDTYSILWASHGAGVRSVHVVNIAADNISC